MFSGTAAAAAAATAGGSGVWLFSYNKENFQNDSGMRLGRFLMARGFANAQVGQYREDIQGIVGATVSKMDAWQTVTTLFLAVGAALSCAGRIGMHGCAPPGWFCGLFSGTIFMSVLFNGISLWLSMHASLRAQCASVSLLTRQVRLPIPSMGQIDSARVIADSFEKQSGRDMFRIPFMRHPQKAPDMPDAEEAGKKGKGKAAAHDPQKEFGSTARDTVPTWIRDEVVVDKGDGFVGEGGDVHAEGEVPDHFRLLMKAQEEWRDFDIYARIAMLYGVVSFLYAVCYYAVGTAMSELRGFWVMWTLPLVFMTAQALIMRLDILQTGAHRFPKLELFGHSAPFIVCAALTLEYRYYYSEAQTGVAWGLALLAIFAHFCMSLRMLDLAWPEDPKLEDMPEEPGRQWWPGSWRLPSAFTKHLWFITPPKKLEDGQHCLLHEMEDMARHGGGVVYRRGKKQAAQKPALESVEDDGAFGKFSNSPLRDFTLKRGNDLPWHLMRVAIITTCLQWVFLMITTSVEIVLGPESLLKPPGEPPWIRDMKYRHYTPSIVHLSNSDSLPKNYRLFFASKVPGTVLPTEHGVDAHAEVGTHTAATTPFPAVDTAHGAEDHGATQADDGTHVETPADVEAPAEEHSAEEPHSTVTTVAPDAHAAADSAHRRLASGSREAALLQELMNTLPALAGLADKMKAEARGTAESDMPALAPVEARGGFMASPLKALAVKWPTLFEPQHLLCAPRGHAAAAATLTRRGMGVVVPAFGAEEVKAEPFALDGISGPLAGAAWMPEGLRVVTAAGHLAECPEADRVDGSWVCRASELPPLPLPEGGRLRAAAVEDHHIAMIFEHLPTSAFVYHHKQGVWHPAGEAHIPPAAQARPSLSFDGPSALLVTTASGDVHRRSLTGGQHSFRPAPPAAGLVREFRGACAASGLGQMIHLALREVVSEGGSRWSPELLQAQ